MSDDDMAVLEQGLPKNPQQKKIPSSTLAFEASLDYLRTQDPLVAEAISQELIDQRSHLKLIASENYSSLAVQQAMGNLLTDKYAEGVPHHRFYAGCANVDAIEELAQKRLIELFGADHAYVQPHSGADANIVAFWSILIGRVQSRAIERLGHKKLEELSDAEYETVRQELVNQKIMAMSLASGGHLTHGYRHNISSKMMRSFHYEVDPVTERLDYDAIRRQAHAVKPLILLAGYSAYTRMIDFALMRTIADEVGAVLMVDMAHFSGLVAGKVFKGDYNPIPFAHIVTSTTHKTLRGPRGGFVLCSAEFKEFVDKGCPLVLGGPLPHVMAAKAVAFGEALAPSFSVYAHKVVENAQTLAEGLIKRGLRLLTGGTENHQVLIDLSRLSITGRQAEQALRNGGITVNRNAIANDKNGPWYTSGIRLGSQALTTLGMGKEEMCCIADLIADILFAIKAKAGSDGTLSKGMFEMTDTGLSERSHAVVRDLMQRFPLY